MKILPYFLLVIFVSTSGMSVTEIMVLSLLTELQKNDIGIGVGAGILFCAAGRLLATFLLGYYVSRTKSYSIVYATAVLTVICTAVILVWSGVQLSLGVIIVSAIIYSGCYVALNYLLNAMVFDVRDISERAEIGKKMQIPFLIAQGVVPFCSGILYDSYGISGSVIYIGLSFIASSLFLARFGSTKRSRQVVNYSSSLRELSKGAISVLMIAGISAFIINWYFSAVLSSMHELLSATVIGAVVSGISIVGIIGALFVAKVKINYRYTIGYLFASSIIAPCVFMMAHMFIGIENIVAIVFFVSMVSLFAGCSTALVGASRYLYLSCDDYLGFYQVMSITMIIATLMASACGVGLSQIITVRYVIAIGGMVALVISVLLAKYYLSFSEADLEYASSN